ncbi:MAG: YeeE/YedE family protein [Methylotenera sp.]|nr:YeeE/YedE family protein [Methylotenera sp.]MDO9234031.1 YeeE/YedE family protein [Methylotenera sp.]MDO9389990.1 YeeE/YedE family protein [Methylotenera sp.]MDP2101790.1 YeeE/YedE family protein [Methylotenera sp.]MDP2281422.1 YeeE/YedE family protein [Methylotenera sp.]
MKKHICNASALIFALLSGLIFGLGLILAGMSNPAKVLAFLDLAGGWDPSLGLVMGGAIAIGLIAFKIAGKRSSSFLGLPMNLPTSRIIDKRLVVGGLVFGIGWGLVGICPAPAFVLLGTGSVKGIIFLVAMLIGMGLFELFESYCKSKLASKKP